MLQSTHLYIAQLLKPRLDVEDTQKYYLGASIPDVRYFAGVPREKTHFSRENIHTVFGENADRSFLKGYDVHLGLDEYTQRTRIYENARSWFPFYVKPFIDQPVVEIAFALISIEDMEEQGGISITGEYIDELKELDVSQKAFLQFTSAVNATQESGSLGGFAEEMMKQERFRDNQRLRKLFRKVTFVENNRLVSSYLKDHSRDGVERFFSSFAKEYASKV